MVEKAAQGHNIYEETLRVPLIIHYPKQLQAGAVTDALVELTDLYPTLAQLIGAQPPNQSVPLSGESLVGLMSDGTSGQPHASVRDVTVSLNNSQATVVTKQHKLGIWLDPGPGNEEIDYRSFGNMLFDTVADPLELNNVYDDPRYREIQTELTATFNQWAAEYLTRQPEGS